jgi:hypothetical protein
MECSADAASDVSASDAASDVSASDAASVKINQGYKLMIKQFEKEKKATEGHYG